MPEEKIILPMEWKDPIGTFNHELYVRLMVEWTNTGFDPNQKPDPKDPCFHQK